MPSNGGPARRPDDFVLISSPRLKSAYVLLASYKFAGLLPVTRRHRRARFNELFGQVETPTNPIAALIPIIDRRRRLRTCVRLWSVRYMIARLASQNK